MINALSVDLEDYFQVSAFEKQIQRRDWPRLPSRIARNTDRVLELLHRRRARATFFVLGWVAKHHPQVVRRVAAAGHEIACHSFWHRLVYELTPEEFLQDTREAKEAIEDASGAEVCGYRAPSYSITRASQWALDILLELGFRYDSSIFPVAHDRYGWQGAGRFLSPIRQSGNEVLWEFPPATYPLGRGAVPAAGGGYLRILPYHHAKWALEQINQAEGHPGCVYFHPWEIDPEQPRLTESRSAWWRHSFGLSRMERKLERLLEDFEFAPLGEIVAARNRAVKGEGTLYSRQSHCEKARERG